MIRARGKKLGKAGGVVEGVRRRRGSRLEGNDDVVVLGKRLEFGIVL
jgi:hypothetical protein